MLNPAILRRRRWGGNPLAAPLALFSSGEEGGWWDFVPAQAFQDDAQTTAAVASDPIGSIADQSPNGVDVGQATGANKATLATTYGTFDGSNDYLSASETYTHTSGALAAVFQIGDILIAAGRRVLVSFADTGTANNYIEMGVDTDRRVYIERNNGGTLHLWKGASILQIETDYSLLASFDGADLVMVLNGQQEPFVEQTQDGGAGWLGDVSGGDRLTIGAGNAGGAVRFWAGRIYSIIVTENEVF